MSMPLYIGRSFIEGPSPLSWQYRHLVGSSPRVRRYVSLLRPVVLSTVRASTVTPAASTRRRIFSQASQDVGAYNCCQTGRPSSWMTSSTGVEVAVDRTCKVPCALADRATASSPSGENDFSPPVGQK